MKMSSVVGWAALLAAVAVLALALTGAGGALAAPTPQPQPSTANPPTKLQPSTQKADNIVPSLLVMGSKGYSLQDGKLTLKGVSPTTIVFADRPERLAGHMPTASLIQDWAEGTSSFAKDPPNADFSVLGDEGPADTVVELKNPSLKGDTLTYDVRVIEGKVPATGSEASLFIDIIGMPATPMSVAGVARRSARRAAFYGY